jgi:hypothetical protein
MMAGASRLPWSAQPPAGLRAITACLGAVHPGGKECLCAGSCRHPASSTSLSLGRRLQLQQRRQSLLTCAALCAASGSAPETWRHVVLVRWCARRRRATRTLCCVQRVRADSTALPQQDRAVTRVARSCSAYVLPAAPQATAQAPKRATMCTAQRRGVIMQS